MPVNQKTLARAPPTQGSASDFTRYKRVQAENAVSPPTKQNPQYSQPVPLLRTFKLLKV